MSKTQLLQTNTINLSTWLSSLKCAETKVCFFAQRTRPRSFFWGVSSWSWMRDNNYVTESHPRAAPNHQLLLRTACSALNTAHSLAVSTLVCWKSDANDFPEQATLCAQTTVPQNGCGWMHRMCALTALLYNDGPVCPQLHCLCKKC